jgi:hypothetical protein
MIKIIEKNGEEKKQKNYLFLGDRCLSCGCKKEENELNVLVVERENYNYSNKIILCDNCLKELKEKLNKL